MSEDRGEHQTRSIAPAAAGAGGSGGSSGPAGLGEQPGDQIGPYRLLEVIGEGGFGRVWLAERREPMVQRIALKIIKPGMDSRAVIARFEQERQALAVMDHPNVARVLDGGVTPAGRPYFVMEHVKGEPITAACDRDRLTIRERLELFIPVCEAVQHAHMKGIIHRDLKPSNILVSHAPEESRSPGVRGMHVKVIDFGVAKAISHALTDKTIYTEQGQIIGTPEYMSPEQAEMGASDIDTRADVYSLGVVLYELLSGSLPFDAGTLRSEGFGEIQRIIREVDPPRPSTRLSRADDATVATITRARRSDRVRIAGELRKELEWIPLKAMRKERGRRYPSAEAMAADIRRYLNGLPLEAAPESRAYVVRKFIQRNRGRLAAVAAVFLALVGGLGAALWQRGEALRQAEIAAENAAAESKARQRAETITSFVTAALRSSDPSDGGSQQTTILQAMERAVADLDSGRFRDEPETEANLRETIGTILENNGRIAEAEPLYAQALAIRRRLFAGDHADVALALNRLGYARQQLGRADEAVALQREALEMARRLHAGDHAETARSLHYLASALDAQGRPEEAEPLFEQTLEMYERLDPGDRLELATAMNNLAFARDSLGRTEEAETLYARALAIYERLHTGDHPDVSMLLNNLGIARLTLGKAAEAEAMHQRALEINRRLYTGDHPDIAMNLNNLAFVRDSLGRTAEAEALYAEALEMSRRMHPGDSPETARCLSNLAVARQKLGKTAEARQGFDEAVAMLRRLFPEGSGLLARVLYRSGSGRLESGDRAGACAELEEALTMAAASLPDDHPHIAEYREALARCRGGAK